MLGRDKTYFNSLKDHIALIPQKPIYHKDRVVQSNRFGLTSPQTVSSTNKNNLCATPHNERMSSYHVNNTETHHFLKKSRNP